MNEWLLLAAMSAVPLNPTVDMNGHLRVANEAAAHRETRRVTEEDFLRMSREPGTIVLDARSKQKYDELHVRGAVHLSFPDMTRDTLARAIPRRTTRVLIYCNNNFKNAEVPFPTKSIASALNISTFIALYDYGYRNVYELGPLVDIATSRLSFEGTEAAAIARRPDPAR